MFRVDRHGNPGILVVIEPSTGKVVAEMKGDFLTEDPEVAEKLKGLGYDVVEDAPAPPAEVPAEPPEEPKKKAKRGK